MKSKAELRRAILNVKSAEEYQKLARENGGDISLEEAEKVFAKIKSCSTPEGKVLDENELASVSGAGWVEPGRECKATVESSSWCWSNDACAMADNVYYDNFY